MRSLPPIGGIGRQAQPIGTLPRLPRLNHERPRANGGAVEFGRGQVGHLYLGQQMRRQDAARRGFDERGVGLTQGKLDMLVANDRDNHRLPQLPQFGWAGEGIVLHQTIGECNVIGRDWHTIVPGRPLAQGERQRQSVLTVSP